MEQEPNSAHSPTDQYPIPDQTAETSPVPTDKDTPENNENVVELFPDTQDLRDAARRHPASGDYTSSRD